MIKTHRGLYPSFEDFRAIALEGKYNIIPVWTEVMADFLTPVSCFDRIAGEKSGKSAAVNAALLESVEGGERWGRYSFIVVSPSEIVKTSPVRRKEDGGGAGESPDPIETLKEKYLKDARPFPGAKDLPRFWGGAVGYVSYDFVRRIEKIPAIKKSTTDEGAELPEAVFFIADTLIIFDHLFHTIKVVCACDFRDIDKKIKNGGRRSQNIIKKIYESAAQKIFSIVKKISSPSSALTAAAFHLSDGRIASAPLVSFKSNMTRRQFTNAVRRAKEYILSGDVIQVVLSQRFETGAKDNKTELNPFDIYRALRITNPSPYMYYFKFGDFYIAGSSPEILVRKEGNTAITKPIAGTRRRGATQQEDEILASELLADPKERAEHVMLVDLGRNDLARVCVDGSVRVDEFMRIEKYSHVMHMVSTVTGRMKKGEDAFSLFKACFPAGTVTGAPKVRAMEIIEELEPSRRGPYAGAVGYFSYDGNMDTAITIRTVIFKNRTAYIQAGAGIVADSVPSREYQETLNKARALLVSVELSKKISSANR